MYLKLQLAILLLGLARSEEVIKHDSEESVTNTDNISKESIYIEERLQQKRSLEEPLAFGGGVVLNAVDPLAAGLGGQLIGQQIEVTNQLAVPIIEYRNIPVPIPQPLPYPVLVPIRIPHPVPVPVYNKIPVPVDKPVPVIIEKPYPVKIVKEVPVPKPVPVPVPVYKTRHIYHIAHAHPKHHDW